MNKKINSVFIIFTIIILILTFYQFNEIDNGNTKNMCKKSLFNSFIRQFYHAYITHLLSNLYVFFQLSYLLNNILSFNSYLILVISLIILLTLTDYILYNNNLIKCSIGFSGVVFGIYTWVLLHNNTLTNNNTKSLIIDLLVLLYPSVVIPNISFIGHLSGIFAGLFIYNTLDLTN